MTVVRHRPARPLTLEAAVRATGTPADHPRLDAGPARRNTGDGFGKETPSLGQLSGGLWKGLGETGSQKHIGWALQEGAPAQDWSNRFQAQYTRAAQGQNVLPAEASQHVYLLVGGLFTERYPGYLDANETALKRHGLTVRRVAVDTDASVSTNAATVAAAVQEAAAGGKKVVLIGHSKGGVDITAALALNPALKTHVRAVVAMQSPYGGTPIASDVAQSGPARALVGSLIQGLFRGDPAALLDLTYQSRQAFVRAHPYPSDIPTVSMASVSTSMLSVTAKASGYLKLRYGETGDGLVLQKDAVIPGSRGVMVDGLDHACSALAGPVGSVKPGPLMEALLAVALER